MDVSQLVPNWPWSKPANGLELAPARPLYPPEPNAPKDWVTTAPVEMSNWADIKNRVTLPPSTHLRYEQRQDQRFYEHDEDGTTSRHFMVLDCLDLGKCTGRFQDGTAARRHLKLQLDFSRARTSIGTGHIRGPWALRRPLEAWLILRRSLRTILFIFLPSFLDWICAGS